jgi:hypothetical protein
MTPRIQKRRQPHFSFIQRDRNRYQNSRNWKLRYRQEALDRIPWGEDTTSDTPNFAVDAFDVNRLLNRLDPLDAFHRLTTLHNPSYLTTTRSIHSHQQALVAATDLRATYKAADISRFSKVASEPYVLHTVDDPHIPVIVDTGASISVSPNVSDFVGRIKPPTTQKLLGLGDGCDVDGEGIIEWQIRDILGTIRTIRTYGYLVKKAPVRLFSPQSYFKEAQEGCLYVDHQRTELTLHDGSTLTFPFADNNIPFMLTDWQPIVGITFQDCSTMTDTKIVGMSVADETNQNLSPKQKELLRWHWKLGHCHFGWVQRLASEPRNQRRRILAVITQVKRQMDLLDLFYN